MLLQKQPSNQNGQVSIKNEYEFEGIGWFLVYIMHLSHTTVNKLCADITGFFLQVRMSHSGKDKEKDADRVKTSPIKYNSR